jgi:hypothetical protein
LTVTNQTRAFINNVSYLDPVLPVLYTALTTGADAFDPRVYGVNTNPFVLKYGEVVEIVLNNLDEGESAFSLLVYLIPQDHTPSTCMAINSSLFIELQTILDFSMATKVDLRQFPLAEIPQL